MALVSVLRPLWRARWFVAVGVVLALLVGTHMGYRIGLGLLPKLESRTYTVGVASTALFVDSRSSQAVDLGSDPARLDIPELIARARLLANLIATSPLRDDVARRAGIDPATFVAFAPSIGSDAPNTKVATLQPNLMTVSFNDQVPIVTINAEAADEATAARIARAAMFQLRTDLTTLVAQNGIPESRQLVIKLLGPGLHRTVQRGPRRTSAVIVAALLFGLWCVAIIVASGLRRMRREAAAATAPAPRAVAAPAEARGRVTAAPRRRRVSARSSGERS